MRREDSVRLRHMRDAALEALSFVGGKNRRNLDDDRMLVLALIKEVEIIGEAASRVSEETRTTLPRIPWASIVAMRNRLIHAYFDVDRDVPWQTAAEDLPALLEQLEAVTE
ncbi:MAG: HepT-like ribonuclease domain-containing protein [Pseudomonadota bacterium]